MFTSINAVDVVFIRDFFYRLITLLKSIFKDCLPRLFHGFRNRHFNKISLDNMLYCHNKLYKF